MLAPHLPLTTAQARRAGVSRRQLSGPDWVQVLRGVHAPSTAMAAGTAAVTRVRAALLVHPPTAVASHGSAARVLGAPVPAESLEHVTVTQEGDRRRRAGVRCHVAALSADEVRVVDGVRITAPDRLFLDLATVLDLVELVVLGDWLVSRQWLTREVLVASCAAARSPTADHARRAATYVRDRVDSPMESRLRMLIVLAGLPEPEVNRDLRDSDGYFLLRPDLSWPALKVAVEYDGRHHLTSAGQWERDVERRNDLTAQGWLLITVTAAGIYRTPGDTLRRVADALDQRSDRRTRVTDGWRRYFLR